MAGPISGIDWVSRMPVGGTYTVSGTPTSITINTGKPNAVGFVFQVFRAGVEATTAAKGSITGGVLKIENNSSTFVLTAADVINWIVF